MSFSPTSTNYINLKIINWDFVSKTSPKELRRTKDPKTINKLINNFIQASSLFADPSYCPPDMVMQFFNLLQIAVTEIVNKNNELIQIIEDKNKLIKQARAQKKKNQKKPPAYALPPIVFQCTFCAKLFKTRKFLAEHMRRRHPNSNVPVISEESPNIVQPAVKPQIEHVVKTVSNVPEISQDLGPFKAEINAMLDHFDTILKTEQAGIRTEFMEQFRRIDEMIQETLRKVQDERNNAQGRKVGQTYASYSDEQAMNERLQATDNSEDTHVYSQEISDDYSYTASYSYATANNGPSESPFRINANKPVSDSLTTTGTTTTTTTTTTTSAGGNASPPGHIQHPASAGHSPQTFKENQSNPLMHSDQYSDDYSYYSYYDYS
ncbi:Zinc finger, C2H2 type family protein [Tritrichomonas foetus]|uniref:Zinc finger, C2H2 type family protein n=1 Tax=Tritrichomonas foetus TaxID=1144522 RepID=A0A1J4KG30_9EUKA|nr:Zinc finger, C2H2 type family protein [Tritrichomonas foetus]|eukprot:OHT10375.1 Zinc finger, C2H2 type family protein [Tritrichomonas foetus]